MLVFGWEYYLVEIKQISLLKSAVVEFVCLLVRNITTHAEDPLRQLVATKHMIVLILLFLYTKLSGLLLQLFSLLCFVQDLPHPSHSRPGKIKSCFQFNTLSLSLLYTGVVLEPCHIKQKSRVTASSKTLTLRALHLPDMFYSSAKTSKTELYVNIPKNCQHLHWGWNLQNSESLEVILETQFNKNPIGQVSSDRLIKKCCWKLSNTELQLNRVYVG